MMHNDYADLQRFEDDGYALIKGFWKEGDLDYLEDQIDELGKSIVGAEFSFINRSSYSMTSAEQSLLYDRLRYLPGLAYLEGSPSIRKLCVDYGMVLPSLMGCSNMRLDGPSDSKHLFAWHQDTLYLLGSKNAVTLWIPLQTVDLERGTIQVIPGSHRGGLRKFKRISEKNVAPGVPFLQRDLSLDEDVTGVPYAIEAERGDLIIFKQMLLHRSTPNYGNQVRWTVQLRVTDLADSEYKAQGFPSGDGSNIFYVDYPGHSAERRRLQEDGVQFQGRYGD